MMCRFCHSTPSSFPTTIYTTIPLETTHRLAFFSLFLLSPSTSLLCRLSLHFRPSHAGRRPLSLERDTIQYVYRVQRVGKQERLIWSLLSHVKNLCLCLSLSHAFRERPFWKFPSISASSAHVCTPLHSVCWFVVFFQTAATILIIYFVAKSEN
jgi:hypothetical protein